MSEPRRRWKRQPVKLGEVLAFRVAPADRLRCATLADGLDTTEGEVARRAWLLGLQQIEREVSE